MPFMQNKHKFKEFCIKNLPFRFIFSMLYMYNILKNEEVRGKIQLTHKKMNSLEGNKFKVYTFTFFNERDFI